MRLIIQLLAVCLAINSAWSQDVNDGCPTCLSEVKDGCPKDEYACLDVINSSQCLGQLIEDTSKVSADSLVKCVVYNGTASSLPGGTKVRNNIRATAKSHNNVHQC
ncbi:hypothetical protein K491DRAFT_683468 [Lophiostoma macrostomum CBS 122681]|uniref:Extracellular membrane protein CFEM domain-containing protein n=1 Tax=Lophiostoma macrostomum CBS 122681 TaxID=1314788 RepID=A0A6A6SQG7_9PLEO|nr:hypothetical protein K491DRAFT_683468 [Lophiostoma macrostomum CBS 122681]